MFVSVVLVAPVTEEFAFRSVTTAVMRRWGDWPAVIFSALILGMAHYSIQSLPVVLTAGFVMALFVCAYPQHLGEHFRAHAQ